MDYTHIFQDILSSNHYLVLATVSETGAPWASPLTYVWDGHRALYYISHIQSDHSLNIEKNNKIGFCIFHTDQIPGNAFGAQGSGMSQKVEESSVPKEIQEKLTTLVSLVILQKEHSFYRIDMTDVFLPDVTRWKTDGNIKTQVELS